MAGIVPVLVFLDRARICTFLDLAFNHVDVGPVGQHIFAQANCTLFWALNAQRRTGSHQCKKTIFLDV